MLWLKEAALGYHINICVPCNVQANVIECHQSEFSETTGSKLIFYANIGVYFVVNIVTKFRIGTGICAPLF